MIEVCLGTLSLRMLSPKVSLKECLEMFFTDAYSFRTVNRQIHSIHSDLVIK